MIVNYIPLDFGQKTFEEHVDTQAKLEEYIYNSKNEYGTEN